MLLRSILGGALSLIVTSAMAQEPVKVGLILPMTGPFSTTGKQVEAGVRFYLAQNGASAGGRKIESFCATMPASPTIPSASRRICWSTTK